MCFQEYAGSRSAIQEIFIQNIHIHISIYIYSKSSRSTVGKIEIKIVDQEPGILNAFKNINTRDRKR